MVPNGSPYFRGKQDVRYGHMVARAVETGLPLVYLNLVGGQDDQVFDGASFVLNPGGELAHHMPSFEEALRHVDFRARRRRLARGEGEKAAQPEGPGADYRRWWWACATTWPRPGSTARSSACRAGSIRPSSRPSPPTRSGPENVHCVMLPSEYTSDAAASRTRAAWPSGWAAGSTRCRSPVRAPR